MSSPAKEGKWAAARARLPQGDIPEGAAGVGKRILIARVLRKISQRDLAKQLGISAQLLIWWESGNSFPDVQQVEQLAAAFGDVKPSTLVKWPGNS